MGIFLLDHHHHHHHHTHSFFFSFSCPCIAPLVLFFPLCHFVFAVVQNFVASLTDLAPFFLSFFLSLVRLASFVLFVCVFGHHRAVVFDCSLSFTRHCLFPVSLPQLPPISFVMLCM